MVVPTTPAQLTGTIGGAIVSGTAPTITFNRPVTLEAGAANVTIIKAAAPTTTVDLGPLRFAPGGLAAQLATTATITDTAGNPLAPLTAGDIITVKPAAVKGVAQNTLTLSTLQGNVSAVVQTAGAAPALSAATGVLTATGGVKNTNNAIDDTNVVVQAKSALPADAIVVAYDFATNAGAAGVATTAAAALNNLTGVTTVTVKIGTIGPVGTTAAPGATSSQVAAAINAGASAVVTATPSNPLSVGAVAPVAAGGTSIGTRRLSVTGASTKPLTAINSALMAYDGNNDGFADAGVTVFSTVLHRHGSDPVQQLRGHL